MAGFATKILVVATLVCLVFDLSQAAPAEKEQLQHGTDSTIFDTAKEKVTDFVQTIKKSTAGELDKVQESIKDNKSKLSDYFSSIYTNIKNKFSSTKTTGINPDDQIKQDAIKAFDEYAEKHSK
ncbi:Hypothetical protein CINCED_3A023530 [Cinara cedri]|uniref:Uncharacterized protein n=1 Tax=Cinara cedri TaxID=506608 RepID=A0A5E4M266_9HEMI|nr:Hypothetical protein CINCED_3A023530 [Cinara cedri]